MKTRKPVPPLVRFFSKLGSWCRYRFQDGDARCLSGAISDHYPVFADRLQVETRIESVIGTNAFTKWNDAPGRTRKQVLEACKRAGV